MVTPPTGDVTLVFTDVEGSTKLWQQFPHAFQSVLATHHGVIRQCIARHAGYEVKTEGDSFMVSFAGPDAAVAFCTDAQVALNETAWPVDLDRSQDGAFQGLRVRMGVHMGTPSCAVDPVTQRMDYYGLMVNRAARIAHAAMGGQILVSQEVHDAVDWERLDVVRVDLGPKPLRDLNEATHLHQILPVGLAHRAFDAPKATRLWRTNLVAAPDTFVGRASELEQVRNQLGGEIRLLTIVGAGGTGKTRLACQFGHEHLSDYEGGVWFADLSLATSEAEILQCVGDALGISLGTDPQAQIKNAIAGRGRTLILLDNFEQVVHEAGKTVGEWMSAPEAFFIVTSRERLRLPGEQILYLDPLDTDEAIALFEARARSVRPGFAVNGSNRKVVEEIVQRLDCMSLAIELAAARISILRPPQLLKRLSQRFRLLRGKSRDTTHRQATLRNAIDWSWRLLEPHERTALAQLSVFSSSLTLEAAEEVLDLDAYADAPWPMDVVESLRDKSLLRMYRADKGTEDQFGMYQSVGEYAAEKLGEDEDAARAARERHMNYYATLCQPVKAQVEYTQWMGRMKIAYPNIVRAMETAITNGDGIAAGETVLGILAVLGLRGPYVEAVEKADRFLKLENTSKAHRALVYCRWLKAQQHLSSIANCHAQLAQALEWARESGNFSAEVECLRMGVLMATARDENDRVPELIAEGLARCEQERAPQQAYYFHMALANYHMDRGEWVIAQESVELAAYLVSTHQMTRRLGEIAHRRGRLLEDQGRLTEARLAYEQSLGAHIEFGDMRGQSICLGCLANIHRIQGRYDEAKTHYQAALRIHRDWGNPISAAMVQGNMGNLFKELGEFEEAERLYRESTAAFKAMGRKQNEAISLGNHGELLIQMGRVSEARGVLSRSVQLCYELNFKAEGSYLTYLARVDRLQGDLEKADESLQRGERLLRASGLRYHLGILLCERGIWSRLSGDLGRAKQALVDAQKIAADLEANPKSELGAAVQALQDDLAKA